MTEISVANPTQFFTADVMFDHINENLGSCLLKCYEFRCEQAKILLVGCILYFSKKRKTVGSTQTRTRKHRLCERPLSDRVVSLW